MELWTISAEELLQAGDVGLIPWSIDDEKQLRGLVRSAGSCPDLEAFRNAVSPR